MSQTIEATTTFFLDIERFSGAIVKRSLRGYQLEPLLAILDSINHRLGLEFLLVFPRQSGKNEAIAQLLVYLMNLFQRTGGQIIYAATGDGLGLGIDRLEDRLDNAWNTGNWSSGTKPRRRCLGNAAVVFLSSHPSAATRGQTAHHLLVIDETQDQVGSHIEAVFTPMRAANNATAVYIGTVKTTADYLWQKKVELEREQRRDGTQRVFLVYPDQVTAELPAYQSFLDTQIRKHGRQHPIVASEYFLEPIDAAGGLFDARRQALMRGQHLRIVAPITGQLYVATLDVAGEDEAATDPIAALARPGRDYTVATIFEVHYSPPGTYAPGPTFHAVDVFVDHGSKHFQTHPQDTPDGTQISTGLVHRLLAWLQHWNVAHTIADQSGVGQGMVSWLQAALGETRVTGYNFSGRGQKAMLGSMFLSLVETGRFKYWDSAHVQGDAWWFWQQVKACGYEIPPDGRFDQDLRWEVSASHRTDTATGPQPTHDDRLISAALIAELDRLMRAGTVVLGTAESTVIQSVDPLAGMGDVF